MRKVLGLFFVMMLVAGSAFAQGIAIDGDLLDWANVPAADVGMVAEETGDMTTGPEFDIQDFYITHDTSYVYVRIDIDQTATFEDGFLNYTNPAVYELWIGTDARDTVGLGWGGWFTFAPDYRIDLGPALDPSIAATEIPVYFYASDYNGSEELYDSVGVASIAVSGDGNALEIAVPREAIGQVNNGAWLYPMAYFVGNEVWDNEEYFPNGAAEMEAPYYALVYNLASGEPMQLAVGGVDWRMDSITIDGDLLDWSAIDSPLTGPIAESTGDSPSGTEADIVDVKFASDSTNFYGMVQMNPAGTLSDAWLNYTNEPVFEMYIDASMGDTTGLTWGWWPYSVNFITSFGAAFNPDAPTDTLNILNWVTGQSGGAAEWGDNMEQTGYGTVMPNGDDNAFEFSIPWSSLNVSNDFHIMFNFVLDFVWGSEEFVPNAWNGGAPNYSLTYSRINGAYSTLRLGDYVSSVGEEKPAYSAVLPSNYTIQTTYPNPFNSTTHITYSVPQTGHMTVAVYDIMGRLVRTLYDGANTAGVHQTVWNGLNASGETVSSGVYFLRVGGEYGHAVGRMVYMK